MTPRETLEQLRDKWRMNSIVRGQYAVASEAARIYTRCANELDAVLQAFPSPEEQAAQLAETYERYYLDRSDEHAAAYWTGVAAGFRGWEAKRQSSAPRRLTDR